jgi:integrase
VKHKTEGRGKTRDIPLGPKSQEVLKPWLKADPDAILFSPREASERHYEASRRRDRPAKRARPKGGKRKKPRAWHRRDTYNKNSYAQAIERACVRAGVPVFRPNQIRHAVATRIRREFGLEAA